MTILQDTPKLADGKLIVAGVAGGEISVPYTHDRTTAFGSRRVPEFIAIRKLGSVCITLGTLKPPLLLESQVLIPSPACTRSLWRFRASVPLAAARVRRGGRARLAPCRYPAEHGQYDALPISLGAFQDRPKNRSCPGRPCVAEIAGRATDFLNWLLIYSTLPT